MSHARTDARRQYEREWQQNYREKNRDKISQQRRARYLNDPVARRINYVAHRDWVEKNREHVSTYNKKWREDNKEIQRYRKIAKKFGVSAEEYVQMLHVQDFKCAICRQEEVARNHKSGRVRSLSVDHDHNSGAVRGLLCSRCNLTIGSMGDDVALMRAAVEYIEANKAKLATALNTGVPATPPVPPTPST